jgi:hypothetical protein
MSSLWTPDGERPIPRRPPGPPEPEAPEGPEMGPAGRGVVGPGGAGAPDEEDLLAVTAELLGVPASAVVANHCVGLFQLAALHLSQEHPDLPAAALAIDAMAAIVEGLGERLGPDMGTLRDALSQIRLAFVQVQSVR